MNIFVLDNDIEKSVQYHCDKHVVKMITEYAQMLSSAVRLTGVDVGYRLTHKNHPCTKWVCESVDNWHYLRELMFALHDEWQYRYDHPKSKIHKAFEVAAKLPIPKLPSLGLTNFAQAMPVQYKHDDAIVAYRRYYVGDKQHLASWKKRDVPYWFFVEKK